MNDDDNDVPPPAGRCVYCGCTELNPCAGGCRWVTSDRRVCSQCEHVPELAAMALGEALATTLRALFALEEVTERGVSIGVVNEESFETAYADLGRLMGYASVSLEALIPGKPVAVVEAAALEGDQAGSRIIRP